MTRTIPLHSWPFRDLRAYLRFLEQQGHLVRIADPVDPYLEISAIAQETVRRNGPALLFERVKGSRFPVVINLFGHPDRIRWALGREPSQIGQELLDWVDRVRRPGSGRARTFLRLALRLLRSRPRTVRRAPVQQVVAPPRLSELPVLTCWPGDGGPFITFGMVLTEHPELHTRNLGIYRLHVYDDATTGMHWQSMKGGRGHYYEAEKRGQDLEVAVVLGGDPILMLSAVLPLPEEMDELMWAGFLARRPVQLVRARSLSLRVPARAEIVLEGAVPPGERRREGPFGDHFGHYSAAYPFPVFHVKTVTHRRDAIYPTTVVGKPPQEDWYMGVAAGEMLAPLIRLVYPGIRRMWAYPETGFHHLLVVSLEERHPTEALKVGLGLLGQGQLALTKCLVLVPPAVDPTDWEAVLRHLWHVFDPGRDLLLLPVGAADTLDYTTPTLHRGGKVILNATGDAVRSVPPKETCPLSPGDLRAGIRNLVWWTGGTLLLQLHRSTDSRSILQVALDHPWIREHALWVIAVSEDVPLDDPVLRLWGIFTRFDPARDWVFREQTWDAARPVYRAPIGIDATWKPFYPEPLVMPADIEERARARVDRILKT